MKEFEFYQNLDLKYPELAICLEDSVDGKAKFYIPILTPLLESTEAYETTDINISKSNILSDTTSMEITACTTANYVELHLPSLQLIDPETSKLKTMTGSCVKGDIFVIVFIGGSMNKPYIIGRYEDADNQ